MKIISLIGLIVGSVGLIAGLYCQLEVVPQYDFFIELSERSLLENTYLMRLGDDKMMYGSIALFGGILALLLAFITITKHKSVSLITLLISIVSIILGLMQATHMFS